MPIKANPALVVMFMLPTVAAILRLGVNWPGGWIWAAGAWFIACVLYLIVMARS